MNNDWDILQNFSKALIDNLNGTFSLRTSSGTNLDTIYARLDGTNMPFTGNVSITSLTPTFTISALSGESLSIAPAGGAITFNFSNGIVDPDTLTWTSGRFSFSTNIAIPVNFALILGTTNTSSIRENSSPAALQIVNSQASNVLNVFRTGTTFLQLTDFSGAAMLAFKQAASDSSTGFFIGPTGSMSWGDRTNSADTTLTRTAAGNLTVGGTSPATLIAGVLQSTVATGTAPLIVASTTNVANLNASSLSGNVIGTSGATIPLLNGNNTWSGTNTFSAQIVSTATTKNLKLSNASGGATEFSCASSIGSFIITFPAATTTVAGLAVAETWTAAQLFNDTTLTMRNVANTFTGTFTCAITAARTWTMPNATTTLVGASQTISWTSGNATWTSASSSILTLTNTGTPQSFQFNLTSGVFTLKDSTNNFTFLTIDPVGLGDDMYFNAAAGTVFQINGNQRISFQDTTFFWVSAGSNIRLDFGTDNTYKWFVASGEEIRWEANKMTLQNGSTVTYLGWVTDGQFDIGVSSTIEMSVTATAITLGSATTDTVNFVSGADGTAPSTSIGVGIVNFYGSSATNFLGDPNAWLRVKRNGTTYKIPCYT